MCPPYWMVMRERTASIFNCAICGFGNLGLAQSHMEEKDLDKEEAVIIIHMQPEDNVS